MIDQGVTADKPRTRSIQAKDPFARPGRDRTPYSAAPSETAKYQRSNGPRDEWSWPGKDVYVLTSSPLTRATPRTNPWHKSPSELVGHLRSAGPARDVWLLGGPKTLHAFRDLGAIDTYELFVLPILLGDGIPLFGTSRTSALLTLVKQKVFSDGLVELVYRPTIDGQKYGVP